MMNFTKKSKNSIELVGLKNGFDNFDISKKLNLESSLISPPLKVIKGRNLVRKLTKFKLAFMA